MEIENLIEMGCYLFPVKEKMPLIKWTAESSNDPEQIAEWADMPGRTGWGIDCGRSGLAVIDVDSGKYPEAMENLDSLQSPIRTLPETLRVQTRSGGYHLYYKGNIRNTASKLGKGLDTRGRGGYVVAPGSPGYTVMKDVPIVAIPGWLAEDIGAPADTKPTPVPVNIAIDSDAAIQMAKSYLERVEPAIEGLGGDGHTYNVACRVRDYGISKDKALELMADWSDRCSPPWTPDELQRKVDNAYKYARETIGRSNPESVFSKIPDIDPDGPRYKLLSGKDIDENYKPMSWLIKGLIPARGIFQMYGPSGSGKSFLALDMLASIAEGSPWFDMKTRRTSTVYVCLEGEAGMKQRKDAWEIFNKRKVSDGFFMVVDNWNILNPKDIRDLIAIIPRHSIVVIDTQNIAAPGADESHSADMSKIITGAKTIAQDIEGCVGLIAHTGKDTSRGVRGHSSQIAAMDSSLELSRGASHRTWRAIKVKDGIDGAEHKFDLASVNLGYKDLDGEETSSCAVTREIVMPVDAAGVNLTESEDGALRSIQTLSSIEGAGSVKWTAWRNDYISQMGLKIKKDDKSGMNSATQAFKRAAKKLVDVKLVSKTAEGEYRLAILTPIEDENCG